MNPFTIVAWLAKIWPTLRAACKVIIAFGGLLSAIFGLLLQFADVEAGLEALASRIDSITLLIHQLPSHQVMNMLNSVFPLTEFLGLTLAYLGLLFACMLVRWLKSILLFWSGG